MIYKINYRFLGTFASIMRLCRAGNSVALGVLFYCSHTFFLESLPDHVTYSRAITWILVASFAYAYNDICDVDIDRINRPDRPIPARALTPHFVALFIWVFAVFTIVFSIIAWRSDSFWPLIAMASAIVYSRYLRSKSPFLSNLTTSGLIALVPLSAFALHDRVEIWAFSLAVALLMFVRELQKDAVDAHGDTGHRPPPLLLGRHKTIVMAIYPWLLLITASLLYFATYRFADSLIGVIMESAVLVTVLAAIAIFLFRRTAHDVQAVTLKIASYLVVILLAVGA
jgi:geranylgeranylglycerol-phosphate geranylgeranyltransferase